MFEVSSLELSKRIGSTCWKDKQLIKYSFAGINTRLTNGHFLEAKRNCFWRLRPCTSVPILSSTICDENTFQRNIK